MATADDFVLATSNEENVNRIDYDDVAIFFKPTTGKPVKIGKLIAQDIETTAEEAVQAAKQHQYIRPDKYGEGTRVRVSFESHLAIDARLDLTLHHIYTSAPTERQRKNGINPPRRLRDVHCI